jgi:hypothetical protein
MLSAQRELLVLSRRTDLLDRLKLCIRQSRRVFAEAEIRRVDKCCVGSDG